MKPSTHEPHGIKVYNTGDAPIEGDPFEVRPKQAQRFVNGQGRETTNPPSQRRKAERTELGEQHTRQAHYHAYDPHLHLPPKTRVLRDEGPIDPYGPVATETTIVYRILARIDGGEWRHDLVGETGAAATFSSRNELEGHLKWLRAQAAKHPEPRLEYTAIPLLIGARAL